jgi:hypothetical protein
MGRRQQRGSGRLRRMLAQALVAALALGAAGCWPQHPQPPGGGGYESPTYGPTTHWLCRPDKADDLCRGGQDATVVHADGHLVRERWRPALLPPVDCFYVYGTVSSDPGLNSDFVVSPDEEELIAGYQAVRFRSSCRVFAPVYRQVTGTALADGRATADPSGLENAYADVLDAFREYVAHHNRGRGFVLLGHSQGSSILVRLLREEIEPNPRLRDRFVSAYVPGRLAIGLTGGDLGGSYDSPVCSRFGQVGCVVSWSTYRSTVPPGPFAFFGRDPFPGQPAACANPAALLDPTATPTSKRWLTPYLPTGELGAPPPGPWVDPAYGTVTTPFVKLPRLVEAQCVGRNGYHWLEATVHGDPADPRVDDIGGEMNLPPDITGLHLLEYNLMLGDLVRLVRVQGEAYRWA